MFVDKVASADLVGGMGKRSPHEATCPRIASGFSEKDAACLPFTQTIPTSFLALRCKSAAFCGPLPRHECLFSLLHFGPRITFQSSLWVTKALALVCASFLTR